VLLPPFSAVLEEHRAAVWRYLAAAAGPVDAPDLYQETLLAALRAYPTLRDAANLRGWLLTIAHHKLVDGARARQRRPVPVDRLPDTGVEAPEADDALWDAVRRLPVKQRSSIVHRYVNDLPYAEIGQLVGCSEAAARQNVRAGLARLREELSWTS
jgi:RNA polymerase sigma factor (sigma-70 family)